MVALRDLRAGRRDALRIGAHAGHYASEVALHVAQCLQQRRGFVAAVGLDGLGEVALGDQACAAHGQLQGPGHGAAQQDRGARAHQQRHCGHDHQDGATARGLLGSVVAGAFVQRALALFHGNDGL